MPISALSIQRATVDDATEIAVMVGELLAEILAAIDDQVFDFEITETISRLEEVLALEKYVVFVAREASHKMVGFIALCDSYALYAGGEFGTITELFVRPQYRSNGIGRRLISQAKALGAFRGWNRLEVTTPPLPQFERALAFYEREGFSTTGGKKLKAALTM
jgi:GNAT superfamily N-acetyltransferase